MDLILSKDSSIEDRNVQLEPPIVRVGTLIDVLRGKNFFHTSSGLVFNHHLNFLILNVLGST